MALDSFIVRVPPGWTNITAEVEADNPPYTLAHRGGVGALQFSIARYESGPAPDPSPDDLRAMVEEFGSRRGLGRPAAMVAEAGPPVLAAGSYRWDEDFIRVWQVSDGRNFAFVTYTCSATNVGPELVASERIVRSIVFRSDTAT